ncbi:hypothetical protein FB639_002099 [Coemansia asiatica]|nr:hypothetical protein FB639_002099 [Coemansia asiatica]
MADFGFEWNVEEPEEIEQQPSSSDLDEQPDTLLVAARRDSADGGIAENEHTSAPGTPQLPPGVVVHRVAASDKQANPHGTTENELLEPMIEDKAKQQQVKSLESEEEANMSALEIFCQRSSSVFIFQRVWAAKEVGRLLSCESLAVAMGVLVPIAMRLAEDRELFVRETMAQNLQSVLQFYYENKDADLSSNNSSSSQAENDETEANDKNEHRNRHSSRNKEKRDSDDCSSAHSSEHSSEREDSSQIVPPISVPSCEAFGTWLHRVLLTPHPSVSLPTQRATVSLGRHLPFDRFHTEIVHGVVLSLVQNPIHQHLMRQRQRSKEMVVKSRASSSPPLPPLLQQQQKTDTPADTQAGSSHSKDSTGSAASVLSSGFASLFGRRSWQSDKTQASETELERNGSESRSSDASDTLDLESIMSGGDGSSIGSKKESFFVSPADEEARLELTRRKLLMLHMIHLVAVEFGANMRPAVFVPVVERSAKDKAFEVRRDAAAVLGSLAKAVSVDLAIDVLFQCFLQLAQDSIWQVRQSAARHALPGLAVVLAPRSSKPPSMSVQLADFERKHSLQCFAKSISSSGDEVQQQQRQQRVSLTSSLLSAHNNSSTGGNNSGEPDQLSTYMYYNQPARSVADKQWLQLVERLASPREPSHHVRAAVFESIGKLTLALVDCPRTRDALVGLVVSDIQKAHSDQGSGRFGLFGSSSSLHDMDYDDDEDDDDEIDEETAAANEANAVMIRALGDVAGSSVSSTASSQLSQSSSSSSSSPLSLRSLSATLRGKDRVASGAKSSSANGSSSNSGSISNTASGASNKSSSSGVNAAGGGRLRARRAVGRDILFQCAYNFPALLAALGPAGWDRLRDVYMQLSKTEHFEARQTLACSLHEVARILSTSSSLGRTSGEADRHGSAQKQQQQQTGIRASSNGDTLALFSSSQSADLESILCLFLIDAPEIKMGALRHLGDTLTWLTAASRVRCLPMIMQVFRHDGKQWRTRELMARQLVKLCHLFPASIVVGSLLPQAVEWAHDPVAGVRAAVAPAFPIVFELTKLDPSTQVKFFETVISFSHAASFRGRLFFIEICSALLAHDQDPDADPVDFDQFFLPSLAALATDRVANVRIALARLVRRMLENRMRRQSISATLADMWSSVCPPSITAGDCVSTSESTLLADKSLRRKTSEAITSSSSSAIDHAARATAMPVLPKLMASDDGPLDAASKELVDNSRFNAHRSLGSVARRPRRNTTPMRAHLLAMMVQQLAKDTDRDVLDLVRDLPGMPISTSTPVVSVNDDNATFTATDDKDDKDIEDDREIAEKTETLLVISKHKKSCQTEDISIIREHDGMEKEQENDDDGDVFLDVEADQEEISAISRPVNSSSASSSSFDMPISVVSNL